MEYFGEKLRTLRQQRGLSLRQLAAQLGVKSYSHLAEIEQGKSRPSLELLVKLADFFEVSTDQLLKDDLTIE